MTDNSAETRQSKKQDRENQSVQWNYKKVAAIFVDVCPCHTIFVSYDDW